MRIQRNCERAMSILDFTNEKRRIPQIKLIRNALECGLKDAKDTVEGYIATRKRFPCTISSLHSHAEFITRQEKALDFFQGFMIARLSGGLRSEEKQAGYAAGAGALRTKPDNRPSDDRPPDDGAGAMPGK